MKNRLLAPCALLLLALVPTAAIAAELKVAVLDPRRAVGETQTAKVMIEAMNKQLQPDINELEKQKTEFTALQQRLEKEQQILGEVERRKLESELRDKQASIQYLVNKLQTKQNDKLQELFQEMGPKLQEVVNAIITAEGFDLVVDRQTVMWANQELDITRRVTEKLNEKK